MKSLGDRIKNNYENISRLFLTKRIPVILRIDGRAFHTFTKQADKPFDFKLREAFILSIMDMSNKISGFKCAYHQSDEVSILLTDYDKIETQAWFEYNLQKLCSITSSMMTARFNYHYKHETKFAEFDCRAFNIPKEEVVNYFLWRALDWERNSLTMYCSSFFSHNVLMNKNKEAKHKLLHSINKNWATDCKPFEKNGTFIFKDNVITSNVLPTYDSINEYIGEFI